MSNEAKTTKAYKIAPELKEKLERLAAESGLDTQEAFIEHLAALYELQRLKEGNGSGYAKQIDELEYHLRRPLDLFIGMVETEAASRIQQSQQHDDDIQRYKDTLNAQELTIGQLTKELKDQGENLVRLTKENDNQVKLVEQLQESVRDKGTIAEQRGQEIATLSGIVNEYKAAAEENKDLKTKVLELTTLSNKQAARVDDLEGDLVTLEALRAEQLRLADERHQEALERLGERKDTEKEREALAIRTEYQAKLEKTNEDATAKIRDLYEQIERQRTAHEQQLREIQQPKDDGKNPPAKK